MAEQVGEGRPDGVQRLLNKSRWDADLVRDDLRDYVVERLGDPDGVLVVVETGFPKKGKKSAGVARQRNPATGRAENCQVGLFLAYGSPRGCAFMDRALYLPKEWAQDEGRRAEVGVPKEAVFIAKGELARAMLERAFSAGVPPAWVTGDAVQGNDEKLWRWLEMLGQPYVLPVRRARILLPQAEAVLPQTYDWARVDIDRVATPSYEWARGPVRYDNDTGQVRWLLVQRSTRRRDDYTYYRAYGPRGLPLAQLARTAATRRTAQESLEQAKGEVGLDEYEVRRWNAWHRHVTLCLLAHASLQVARTRAKIGNLP